MIRGTFGAWSPATREMEICDVQIPEAEVEDDEDDGTTEEEEQQQHVDNNEAIERL